MPDTCNPRRIFKHTFTIAHRVALRIRQGMVAHLWHVPLAHACRVRCSMRCKKYIELRAVLHLLCPGEHFEDTVRVESMNATGGLFQQLGDLSEQHEPSLTALQHDGCSGKERAGIGAGGGESLHCQADG